jgi:hypothetical protein
MGERNGPKNEALQATVLETLQQHPEGLGEFDLIKVLRTQGFEEFGRFDGRLGLFRAHFILFHNLYRLRDRLWDERRGHLEISALRIRLVSYEQGVSQGEEGALGRNDPLRDYYLDGSNLDGTTEQDVQELLESFWQRYNQGIGDPDERRKALRELELDEPVDFETIKRQYRRLSMEHHPDRGGDPERLRSLNAAMAFLSVEYGK